MNDFLSILNTSSKELGRKLVQNSPTILTAMGVAGLVSTVAYTIKGTIKAVDILHNEAEFKFEAWEKETGEHRSAYPDAVFTTQEVLMLTWRPYIPAAIMGVTTIACIVGSNHISSKRNAALVSLFTLAETTLKQYQEKVVETIGEKKEELIRGQIAQDKIDANPPEQKAIILTHHGSMLCYDALSGRYFYSDVETLRKAMNDFNARLMREMSMSLNEFYLDIGLDQIDMGAQTGWDIERSGPMDLYLGGAKVTKDGQPCIVVEHRVLPINIWG